MSPSAPTKKSLVSPHAIKPATTTHRTPLRARTANVTIETFVLAAALLALTGIIVVAPEIAKVLFGIPAAAAFGLATLAGIARYLGR